MATQSATVETILAKAAGAGAVTARKMFGEYTLYCDGKVVGLVCNDILFVKPTGAARAWLQDLSVEETPPYHGAKPCLLITADRWEDGAWLSELIALTARALPATKPRKRS